MKQTIYMFSAILLLMTLISALGGGFRTTENFYNEVFDLEDGSSKNEPYEDAPSPTDVSDAADNAAETTVLDNDESLLNEAPVEKTDEVEEEFYEGFSTDTKVKESKNEMNVEPYESDSFATF